jgi:phosphoethanolamine N-methyltransferase
MHIHDKKRLFAKLYSLLNDGGQLVITDYARGPKPGTPEFEAYAKSTGYHLVEPATYGKFLEDAGFVDVVVEDATPKFTDILKNEPVKLEANREDFLGSFSEADLKYLVDRWAMKVRFCDAGDMKWGIYKATKRV